MQKSQSANAFSEEDVLANDQEDAEDLFFTKIYEPLTWDNIQRFLPPDGGRVLDAGGGGGRWAVELLRRGYHVTLTDISQGMLEVAREKLKVKGLLDRAVVQRADVRDMKDLPSDYYSLAMVQGDALSYCEDADQALAALSQVTRMGGHVIVSANGRMVATEAMSMGFWREAERILSTGTITWHGDDEALPFPFHTFTVSELQGLFEKQGLQVVRVLGKPIFFPQLAASTQQRILQNPRSLEKLLDLETRFADDPAWAGSSSHFEMVGVKVADSSVQLPRKVWSPQQRGPETG